MTRRDSSRLGTQAQVRKAAERAAAVRRLLEQGECVKRAAWKAGVSVRTARRYRQGWQ